MGVGKMNINKIAGVGCSIAVALGALVLGAIGIMLTFASLRYESKALFGGDPESVMWFIVGLIGLGGCALLIYGIYYYWTDWQQRD